MAYTLEQRSQAKALALAHGSAEKAADVLSELWDDAPSSRAILNWYHDPSVEPDLRFLRSFSDVLNARIIHYVDRLVGPLAKRIEEGIEGGTKALDLHNDVRSFTFLANLVRPANASGAGGTNVYSYVDNRMVATRDPMMLFGPRVIMPYGPKETEESSVVEAEVRALPAPTEAQPSTAPRGSVAKQGPALGEPPSLWGA